MSPTTRKRSATIAIFGLTLIALACTCGPLSQVQGLQATAGAAQGTLGAVATEFGENLPTLEAELTALGPTLNAQLTQSGPTLEAAQTQVGEALPSLEAQLTELVPTLQGGLAGEKHQWAARATASSQRGEGDYSAQQAAGEPNTPECGEFPTAWSSATPNGVDWLRLEYDMPVTPVRIEIHQSRAPGSIVQVEMTIAGGGVTHIVYEAQPQVVETCPFVLVIPVTGIGEKMAEIIVHLDQTNHPTWNQIDAVELIGIP
jgi:hypothetical protein